MNCLILTLHSRITQTSLAIHSLKACAQKWVPEMTTRTLEASTTQPLDEIIPLVLKHRPNLLCLSCYIWNMETQVKLIAALRRIDPDLKILLGGHEVSHDDVHWIQEGIADFVIRGEGELTFVDFLKEFTGQQNFASIPGLTYRDPEKGLQRNPPASDIRTLDELPSPFTEEATYSSNFVYYEASRGCPYKCHFCLSALDKGARFYSLERFEADMQEILSRSRIRQVKFVDRTFNLSKRRTLHIFRYLMEHGKGRNFHFEIAAELFSDEAIELLQQAEDGMFQFEIGIQSIHKDVLDGNGRRCKFERLEEVLDQLLARTRVHIHGDLIAGLAGESPERFYQSFDWVLKKGVHHFQIEVLKILKGSISESRARECGYVFMPHTPYTLLKSKEWSYQELSEVQDVSAILEIFWNRDAIRPVLEIAINHSTRRPWDFFLALSRFVLNRHPSRTGLHMKKAFAYLAEFLTEEKLNSSEIQNLMTLEYLNRIRTRSDLPFEKTSRTKPPKDFPELAERKGFVECFGQLVHYAGTSARHWYFPAEPSRPPKAVIP